MPLIRQGTNLDGAQQGCALPLPDMAIRDQHLVPAGARKASVMLAMKHGDEMLVEQAQ